MDAGYPPRAVYSGLLDCSPIASGAFAPEESAWDQNKLLDRDFRTDFEMRDIGKKKHRDLIEFSGGCVLRNKKAQNFFGWSRLHRERASLARKHRFASEQERRFAGHSRVRERNGEGDRSGNVISVFDRYLDFPKGRKANWCVER